MSTNFEEYLTIKAKLKQLQALEKKMRLAILEETFGDEMGTVKCETGGYLVKGNFGVSIKLDISSTDLMKMPDVIQDCIKREYKLINAKYNDLTAEESSHLDDFITAKPSLPTLTLTELDYQGDGE